MSAYFGRLPPQYRFALNTRLDARFTRCPECKRKMKQRTLPLIVHVEPRYLSTFVQTCRYCPDCDLLIAHADLLGAQMLNWFAEYDPSVVGNEYVIIGTMERQAWDAHIRESRFINEVMGDVHDFAAVVRIEGYVGNWRLIDVTPDFLEKKQGLIDAAIYTLETPKE